jgi:hypothetical protein
MPDSRFRVTTPDFMTASLCRALLKAVHKTAGWERPDKDIRRSTTELPARNMDQVGIEPTAPRVTGEVTLPYTTSNFFCLSANLKCPRPGTEAFSLPAKRRC